MPRGRQYLTEEEKDKIYDLWTKHREDGVTREGLAQRFDCSMITISRIISEVKKKRANDISTSV
jgi:DNA invertase Pin-like site-specific DNA recombinase